MGHKKKQNILNKCGMTLIEILLVVSLVAGISITLYHSLVNGLKVWQKSQLLVAEEDVAVFFDKISFDLKNAVLMSNLRYYGHSTQFGFPAIVKTLADPNSTFTQGEYVDQIGSVEYYFDSFQKTMNRRAANYSLALNRRFGLESTLIHSVSNATFKYYYFSDQGESISDVVLDVIPIGVEIEIELDGQGAKKILKRYIEIPIGS